MTLPSSGPMSLAMIQSEFGGSSPISISEYYGRASGIPSSGQISFSHFYGKSNITLIREPSSGAYGIPTTPRYSNTPAGTYWWAHHVSSSRTKVVWNGSVLYDSGTVGFTSLTVGGVTYYRDALYYIYDFDETGGQGSNTVIEFYRLYRTYYA